MAHGAFIIASKTHYIKSRKKEIQIQNIVSKTKSLELLALSALGSSTLLWQQYSLDVGQDSALGNGHSGQQLVQLLVITDGELEHGLSLDDEKDRVYLEMSGDDPGLLVVSGGISSQLEDLGGQVLHDGGKVDWGSGTDSLGIVAFAQQSGHEH